jgi:hypothetical protein
LLEAIELEGRDSRGSLMEALKQAHLRLALFLGVISMQLTTSIWPIIYLSTELLRRVHIEHDAAELVSSVMLLLR